LASGDCLWGIVGNLDARNHEMNEHFVTISIERNGRWFHLARYHDADYAETGPQALARFLGLAGLLLLAAKRRTPHKIDKFLLVLPAFRARATVRCASGASRPCS